MSAASDGGVMYVAAEKAGATARRVPEITVRTAKNNVCRKRDFELVCTQPVEPKAVVEAIVSIVQPPQLLEGLQQINNRKYIISFKSETGAKSFFSLAPQLSVAGTSVSCRWLGAEFKKVKIAFLPLAVPNEELAAVLRKYGRVLQVTEELHEGVSIPLKTGTRFVDMEMTTPVPNMISVHGFTVPAIYRGVVMQCRRCLQTGHLKAECNVPYCDRCRSFGHTESVCGAPCLKCKAPDHHWRDCVVRNYAFATVAATNAEAAPVPGAVDPMLGTQAQGASSAVAAPDAVVKERWDCTSEHTAIGYMATSDGDGPAAARTAYGGDDTAAMSAPVAPARAVTETSTNAVACRDFGVRAKDAAAANADEIATLAPALSCAEAAAVPVCGGAASASAEQLDVEETSFADVNQTRSASAVAAKNDCSRNVHNTDNELPVEVSLPDVEQTKATVRDSAGHVNKAIDTPKHLEWKRAITRSKRKLMTSTPGQSPQIKKSAAVKRD